jgi:uncharacterized delta-60 repeat protein
MKNALLINALLFAGSAAAQINVQWESRYNGLGGNTTELVADMTTDAAGNVYVTGSAYTASTGYDIVTIKYNNAGVQQWIAVFNGSFNGLDEARALTVDASGNVYVTGYSARSSSNYDYTTIKYNASGTQLWQQYYDAGASLFDDARDIAVDASGNVYVTGSATVSSTNTNIRTVKYDAGGNQQWAANFSSSGNNLDQGVCLVLDASSNVYVAGNAFNTGQDLNYRILKYDAAGTQIWTTQYNHTLNSYDYPVDMRMDASGNLFVTGYSYNGAASDDDIHTIKINSAGTVVNSVIHNGTANAADIANAIFIDATGNVYVAGRSKNSGTAEDFFVAKYDNALNLIWNDSYNGGGGNYDEATDIVIDNSGNVYATGYSFLSATNNDYMTIKYDGANGARLWSTRFNGTANNSDQAKKIAVDAAGNVYVSGNSRGSGTNNDYSTIKYCQLTTNAGTDEQLCIGDNVQLNASGGTVWNWSPSAGLSSTTISNPFASPSSTTTYIVSSTDGNGCTDYDTIEVVVNPLPGPVITPDGPTSFCIGDSVTLSASGFASYSWNTGSIDADLTVHTSGTYTVTVVDAMMCSNFTSVTVTVNALPSIDAGTTTPFCMGDSTQLNALGGVSYVWDTNPDLSSTSVGNPYASPVSDSWFYVTGTDANGCSNSDSVLVQVNPLPAQPTITFVQSNHTIVTNNTSGNTWYFNGSVISGQSGQVITAGSNGDYWVIFTDGNGCSSVSSDTVTVQDIGIEEENVFSGFQLAPNPASSVVFLDFSIKQPALVELSLINAIGQVVLSSQSQVSGQVHQSLNINEIPAGVYLVRVQAGNQVLTRRLVVRG